MINAYTFKSFFASNGYKNIVVKPELKRIDEKGICFILPETCIEYNARKVNRAVCRALEIQLLQNGAVFNGVLLDFSTRSFKIQLHNTASRTFQWINPDLPVQIIIFEEGKVCFSGDCKIIKNSFGYKIREFILEPVSSNIRRFKPKEYRSIRQKPMPLPNIRFLHPLTGKFVDIKAGDISASGFSVKDNDNSAALLPGLLISNLSISFSNSFTLTCSTQVLYSREAENTDGSSVIYGVVILDMDAQDHVRLSSILHQAEDDKSYLCNMLNLDELWRFFFNTGFIYPQKYEFIQANKNKIREIYSKLYLNSPSIARHFTYQDNDKIIAHVSMLRFYENSWMIHHHAADSSISKAGLSVLNQLCRFTNDSHSIPSSHMQYYFCYYRQGNRFPEYVFGGIAKKINNQKICSLDSFAYLHADITNIKYESFSGKYSIDIAEQEDLLILEGVYEEESGGLMINALDMSSDMFDETGLSGEYNKIGLKREKHFFSLKINDLIKAVFMINISDDGLNLSDLTNSIMIFVIDQEDVSSEVLLTGLMMIREKLELTSEMPVLLYPVSYADNQKISYEKIYTLWIYNMQDTDQYYKAIYSLM